MSRTYLMILPALLLFTGTACQKKTSKNAGERQKSEQAEPDAEEPEEAERDDLPEDEGDTLPVEEQGPEDEAKAEEPNAGGQESDPDALEIRVVFHFSESRLWKSADQMQDVTTEVQRILGQAKLIVEATYTNETQGDQTDLDVFLVPSIGGSGTNGISFGGRVEDIQVRDDVRLGRVDDQRPAAAGLDDDEAEQARTIAHEIGHQLGLDHRQNRTNLMASGTTGWTLNDQEIATLRSAAERRFGR